MQTEKIQYVEGGDTFDAVVVYPEGTGAAPAVLVCHAWGGRDEFAEDKAKKLAALGYIGAAIDMYGLGKRGTDKESNGALMMPLLGDRALLRRRLAAAYQAVRTLDRVDPDRVAVMGYCFGGLCALDMARMGAKLRAAISFHGLLRPAEGLDGDIGTDIHAGILVLHGQNDPMVPPSAVGAFAEEMFAANASWRLHSHAGVMHSFTNPKANDPASGTVYDADADASSWAAMKGFLEERFI